MFVYVCVFVFVCVCVYACVSIKGGRVGQMDICAFGRWQLVMLSFRSEETRLPVETPPLTTPTSPCNTAVLCPPPPRTPPPPPKHTPTPRGTGTPKPPQNILKVRNQVQESQISGQETETRQTGRGRESVFFSEATERRGVQTVCRSVAQLPPELHGNMTPTPKQEEEWEHRFGSGGLDLLAARCDI